MELVERIEAKKALISDRLDPDFGLLDELLASRSLTRPEVASVKGVSDSYGRSQKLMGYVSDKGIYDEFLEALRNTEQTHLVNFILGNEELCPEYGQDWPLTEREISILDTNQRSLIDLLDTCDLLHRLYSLKVVNNRQRDFVSSKPTSHEKNEALLEMLRRSSLQNYRKMIYCLHASKQSHIVDIFREGGVVVRVDAELETETNVDEVENELITKITELLSDRSLGDSARIMECSQLRLIAAKKSQSILLYVFCKTSAELANVREMQTSGKLMNVIRKMFNEMLSRAQVKNVTTRLSNEDFLKCEMALHRVGAKDEDEVEENLDKDDEWSLTSTTTNKTVNMTAGGEQSRVRQLKDVTECSICTNEYTDPRMLPCVHTFCFQCLSRTGEAANKKRGDKVPCPLCRKEFIIPVEGIAGLQKNFFMENLIQTTTNLEHSKTTTTCAICKMHKKTDATNIPEATVQCIECQRKYCDDCSKQHLMLQPSKSHKTVQIGSKTDEGTRSTFQAKHCSKHNQKPLDYYCDNCKQIVCVSCFVESHKLHDCKDVATFDKEFRYNIEKNAWKMSSYNDEMLSLKMNVEQRKTNFLNDILEKEDAIRKRSLELKNMVDQHTGILLEELHLAKSRHLKEFEHTIEEVDRCCTILTSFGAYCTQLRSKGSASDICSSIDEVMTRAVELEKDREEFIDRPYKSIEVSFKPADLREVLWVSNNNIVGRILGAETETTAQFENNAIVVGLSDGPFRTRDVVQIKMRRPNEISTQQQIPTTMKNEATAAVYCNTMYVTGIGYNANEMWKYNVASGWMKCASLVQGRRRHSAAFIDEVLYICGGFVDSDGRALDSVEAYNAVTDKCSAVGKVVHCVQNSASCVPFKTSIYIFGGGDENNKALNHVQVYDTKLNTCTLLSKPMPRPCSFMRAALWETSVVLVGRHTCFIFNFEKETWQKRKQFKTDVIHFGLILENERLFVIGGGINETDKHGRTTWKCRDDVRFVPLKNFIDDKPIEWKIHARLPKPAPVHSYAKLKLPA